MRESLGKLLNALVRTITLGRDGQSFLGATWIEFVLRYAPKKFRWQLALYVLGLSPHYFYRWINPDYQRLSRRQFLNSEFERNRSTREKLCTYLLAPHFKDDLVVVDYGCGPGFLAKSSAQHVRTVYAIDLARGTLQCARILNSSDNITYLHTTQLNRIDDASIDLVYSIAVVQHVTDSVFATILAAMHRMLKSGGKLVMHIALHDAGWKTEEDWVRDTSLLGNLKYKYSLHMFNRTEQSVRTLLEAAGFSAIDISPVSDVCPDDFDDVCRQHLILAAK